MEASGAISRHLSGVFGHQNAQSMEVYGANPRRVHCRLSVSGVSVGTGTRDLGLVGRRNSGASFVAGNMDSRFCDDGHLRYYYVGPRCHGRVKKEKEAVQKKLKLLKGLSGDLSASYQSGFEFHFYGSSIGEFHGDRFSVEETREALERQLQQLKTEEKEQKRKRKLEKSKLKAARLQTILDSSSSSSSESSDNEANVINRSYQIRKVLSQPFPDQWQKNAIQGSKLPLLQTQQPGSDAGNVSVATQSTSAGRVEVCMGNKCKKAGAVALMEEFERVMGADGAVCGCKCMGKCRDGPNVRVSGSLHTETHSVNSLCIGVGVEDVDRIVAEFVGQGHQQFGFAPAT